MGALLVSLMGTVLILGKMNTEATPITGATAIAVVSVDEEQEQTMQEEDAYGTVVRVVGSNQTGNE